MKIPMWKRRLTVVQASLKDKATPSQVAKHIQRIVKRQHPHLIGATEAQGGDSRAVKDLLGAEGYNATRKGGRLAVWRVERLRLMRQPKWVRLTYVYPGTEAWRDAWVLILDFEDRANGLKYRVFLFHFPAGVEQGDLWKVKNVNGVRVHAIVWGLLRQLMVEAEREGYEPIALGDSNLNSLRKTWRQFKARHLNPVQSAWAQHLQKRGSHGKKPGRLIDDMLALLPFTKAWVMALVRWFPMDHDVVIGVLNLTPALRKRGLLNRKKK